MQILVVAVNLRGLVVSLTRIIVWKVKQTFTKISIPQEIWNRVQHDILNRELILLNSQKIKYSLTSQNCVQLLIQKLVSCYPRQAGIHRNKNIQQGPTQGYDRALRPSTTPSQPWPQGNPYQHMVIGRQGNQWFRPYQHQGGSSMTLKIQKNHQSDTS